MGFLIGAPVGFEVIFPDGLQLGFVFFIVGEDGLEVGEDGLDVGEDGLDVGEDGLDVG